MKIAVLTLGCKVNQYESEAIMQELKNAGHEVFGGLRHADVYIINTCAVTNEAEHKSREYIAKCNKLNEKAKIIVCGCASEHNSLQFENIKNVTTIFGTSGKNKILNIIDEIGVVTKPIPLLYEEFNEQKASRTRAFLKVQDGCDYFCSYCIIPYVRGRSRSRNLNNIYDEALKLAKNHKEIVVTGINVTDFKIDNKPSLSVLMEKLKTIPARIRLSSFEVNAIDEKLLQTLKDMPNFCPQFHLSLQSGCNKILKLMNRKYTKEEFLDKIELIRRYFPTASISTDVIVGFPTETEEDFLECVKTIKTAKFFFIHIFPYSSRSGTVAEKLKKVDNLIVKERVKTLKNLSEQMKTEYLQSVEGTTQTALTESVKDEQMIAHTEQFVKVYLPKNTERHKLVKVKIGQQFKDGVIAELI